MWNVRGSLPISDRNLCLGSVQHLLKLGDPVTHSRMHVCLGALDVVMKVVTEQLDVRDGGGCDVCVGKMARGQDECDIADLLRRFQTCEATEFERWVAIVVQNLRGVLDSGKSTRVDEFLTALY